MFDKQNVPQLILNLLHSILFDINEVTIFAAIFSILSIITSVFEYISAKTLLNSELVTVIKFDVDSKELASLDNHKYKQLCNHRRVISIEISKIIDIDRRSIELLLPIQTKNGLYLTFHIRSDASQGTNIMKLIKTEATSGYLSDVIVT